MLSGIVSQQIQTESRKVLLYLLPYIPSLIYFSSLMILDYALWRSYKNNTAFKDVKICQQRSFKQPLKLPPGLTVKNNSRKLENMKVLICLHMCAHQMCRFQTHGCVFLREKNLCSTQNLCTKPVFFCLAMYNLEI